MNRHERIRELHAEALQREPGERTSFLDRECGDDAELREEVDSLLSAFQEMGGFLETSAAKRLAGEHPAFEAGDRVGGYEIVRPLGSGGAGTVYEAMQERPRRRVALKVMRAGIGTSTAQRRFEDEAEILARLEHPDIATVYEAGIHDGVPFFAMEYIEGARTLRRHAEAERLSTRRRLAMTARIADAIHHGHQKGIIHRDIKPGNLLVNTQGRPKVIDFGIAQMEDADTDSREIAGTVAYMSPEQCEPGDVDVRSDVYSLGVVLYELLTGRLPYDLAGATITEAARRIRDEPLAAFPAPLRGDVEAIVRRAIMRDREERYASAAALADDIRRHLDHFPVEARSAGLLYQWRRFIRRQRVAFAALAAVFLTAVVSAFVSGFFAVENARERRIAQRARDDAQFQAYVANLAAADAALRDLDIGEAARLLQLAPPGLRNWEWSYLADRLDRSTRILSGREASQTIARLDEGGSRILAISNRYGAPESIIAILDTDGGNALVERDVRVHVKSAAFLPDDRHVAWVDGRMIVLADAETLETVWRARDARQPVRVASSPDGSLLATVGERGKVRLWDAGTGESAGILGEEEAFFDVAFEPDGERVAAAGTESVVLWNRMDGRKVAELETESRVLALRFSPTGDRLAAACADAAVRVWEVETGRAMSVLRGREEPITGIEFDEEGLHLVTGHLDGTLTVWDTSKRAPTSVLWGHTRRVTAVQFVPGGDGTVVSSADDGTIRFWESGPSADPSVLGRHERLVRCVAYSPDSEWLAAGCFDNTVRVYRSDIGEEIASLEHASGIQSVRFSLDGSRLATGTYEHVVRLWEWASNDCLAILEGHTGSALTVAVSPDDRWVASGSTDRTAILWDAAKGEAVHALPHASWVWWVHFLRDGKRLLTADSDGRLRVWDVATGRELPPIVAETGKILDATLSPDESTLATGHPDELKLWDSASGELLATRSVALGIDSLAFSPDGTRLAGTAGSSIKLFDVPSAQPVLNLRGHTVRIYGVAFRPDGAQIASGAGGPGGADCTVRVWGEVPSPR